MFTVDNVEEHFNEQNKVYAKTSEDAKKKMSPGRCEAIIQL